MFVEFLNGYPSGGHPGSEALSHQDTDTEYDWLQGRWEKERLRASAVEMNSEFFQTRPDYQAVSVLVHEMLHALGLQGHVDAPKFADSIMYDAWFRLDGALPAIDAAGVQVLYTRLDDETEEEEISYTSFGDWELTTVHVTGEFGNTTFGVRHSNGVSMPWTAGDEPIAALADNSRLTGTATWTGELLGVTPQLFPVTGDARLRVHLDTLTGRADFTELHVWPGSGIRFGDGTLGYTIAVGSNYLYSTGGDDGTVNGHFYGRNHEDVAGSLERDDLTAAFGARRER